MSVPERRWLGRHYLTTHERQVRRARLFEAVVVYGLCLIAAVALVGVVIALRRMR